MSTENTQRKYTTDPEEALYPDPDLIKKEMKEFAKSSKGEVQELEDMKSLFAKLGKIESSYKDLCADIEKLELKLKDETKDSAKKKIDSKISSLQDKKLALSKDLEHVKGLDKEITKKELRVKENEECLKEDEQRLADAIKAKKETLPYLPKEEEDARNDWESAQEELKLRKTKLAEAKKAFKAGNKDDAESMKALTESVDANTKSVEEQQAKMPKIKEHYNKTTNSGAQSWWDAFVEVVKEPFTGWTEFYHAPGTPERIKMEKAWDDAREQKRLAKEAKKKPKLTVVKEESDK